MSHTFLAIEPISAVTCVSPLPTCSPPPQLITMIINALVAIKRIEGFLKRDEAALEPVGRRAGRGERGGVPGGNLHGTLEPVALPCV